MSALKSSFALLAKAFSNAKFLFWAVAAILGAGMAFKVLWELSYYGFYYIDRWAQTDFPLWKILALHLFGAMIIGGLWRFFADGQFFPKVSEATHQTDAIIAAINNRPPR